MPPMNPDVNKNLPTKLFISPDYGPCAQTHNGITVQVPASKFGAWWIATRYPNIEICETAKKWWQTYSPFNFTPPSGLLIAPRKYQCLGVARMEISNCGIWFDMGLGKTYCSIMFALKLFENKISNFFLILCPTSVFLTWLDEPKKIIKPELKTRVTLIHGTRRKRKLIQARLGNKTSPHFLITSYETLKYILKDLSAFSIGAIFADESTKVKTRTTARTKAVFELRGMFPKARRFCLSGTPSMTKLLGYYSQLEWLNDGSTEAASYRAFEDKYVDSGLFMKVRLPTGGYKHIFGETEEERKKWLENNFPPGEEKTYAQLKYFFTKNYFPNDKRAIQILHFYRRKFRMKNLDHLHRILQTHSYTVKKKDVAQELPPKTYMIREVKMTKEQKKLYLEISHTYKATLKNKTLCFSDKSSPHAKLHQIANGFLRDTEGNIHFLKEQPKLKELENFISELGDEKLVIWSPLRPQIKQVFEFLVKNFGKESTVEIHGGTEISKRPNRIRAFQKNTATKFLIANPEVAGMGLNLQCSNTQIFLTNWQKPDVRSQAEDRQHRIGQQNPVTIVDFICKGTLERKLLASIRQKIVLENLLITTTDLTEGKEKWD